MLIFRFINHLFYFGTISSKKVDEYKINEVPDEIDLQISRSFTNISHFKNALATEIDHFYGVGFVWLCRLPGKNHLSAFPTLEDNTPLSSGFQPLTGIDLWEHAYFTKYLNNRYIVSHKNDNMLLNFLYSMKQRRSAEAGCFISIGLKCYTYLCNHGGIKVDKLTYLIFC